MPTALNLDTSAGIELRQVEQWRAMTPAEKAAMVSGLTQAAFEMARAGVRYRYPDASPREQYLRMAVVTLGPDLAVRAYPEITDRLLP